MKTSERKRKIREKLLKEIADLDQTMREYEREGREYFYALVMKNFLMEKLAFLKSKPDGVKKCSPQVKRRRS